MAGAADRPGSAPADFAASGLTGAARLQLLPSTPGVTKRAEAELRNCRVDIEKEKGRSVPPYPFYHHSMGFQSREKSCALQISNDGGFKYCVTPESADGSPSTSRRIITFEGVFAPTLSHPPKPQDAAPEQEGEAPKKQEDVMSLACIEGRAMVCYMSGDHKFDGNIRLLSAERGDFRFMIMVRPFFSPTEAKVEPRFRHADFSQRLRTLIYVGPPGTYKEELDGNGAHGPGGGVLKLRCDAQKRSYSRIRAQAGRSQPCWQPATPSAPNGVRLKFPGLLSSSASAPMLKL